jgi:hypothetical protein
MSYYHVDNTVYFGESLGADLWIERNVRDVKPVSAPRIRVDTATELAPGVTRYEGGEQA